MKLSPMTKAWARPSGLGCGSYSNSMPHCEPSPRSSSKRGRSCGVLMTRIYRMPASIRHDSG